MRHSGNELVSIITATYNREKYLPLAVESVLKQTYPNIEYHVVDDGSADNTRRLIEPYLNDRRIHYYYQENRGQATARNTGLRHSTGEFICFLDSDDIWKPEKLEQQLEVFRSNPDADIVYSDMDFIDRDGLALDIPNMPRYSGLITDKLLIDNCVSFDTAMVKQKCFAELGGLDESLTRSDDYELWLRFSTRFKFYYHPVKLSKYRIMENQLSNSAEARLNTAAFIMERFLEQNPRVVSDAVKKASWCHMYTTYGRHYATQADYKRAFAHYLKAMYFQPWSLRLWKSVIKTLALWTM